MAVTGALDDMSLNVAVCWQCATDHVQCHSRMLASHPLIGLAECMRVKGCCFLI